MYPNNLIKDIKCVYNQLFLLIMYKLNYGDSWGNINGYLIFFFSVNELSGKGMLKFTRYPYTHWCFTFYNDPTLQLEVETQFQGRSWAQVNSIIANQVNTTFLLSIKIIFYLFF